MEKKPLSPQPNSENSCFDCNICLDSAHEPVVTLCGHLYCWPCIYKWLHVRSTSSKCPICKSNISISSLVPLYGCGTSQSNSKTKNPYLDISIPRRPSTSSSNTSIISSSSSSSSSPSQEGYFSHPFNGYPANVPGGSVTMTSLLNLTIRMFGDLVFARMFGTDAGLFSYPYPNSYTVMGYGNSPRMRRREMEIGKSLSRVSVFLFCCFLLCLLLF